MRGRIYRVEATGGRPLSVSLMQRDEVPGQFKRILKRMEAIAAKGRTAFLARADAPPHASYLERMGFEPVPGAHDEFEYVVKS